MGNANKIKYGTDVKNIDKLKRYLAHNGDPNALVFEHSYTEEGLKAQYQTNKAAKEKIKEAKRSLLWWAVYFGSKESVKILLEAKADRRYRPAYGQGAGLTPYEFAKSTKSPSRADDEMLNLIKPPITD
jgi:hypothetical protein